MRSIVVMVASLLLITGIAQAQDAPTTIPETKENLQRSVTATSSSEKELIDRLQQLEELFKRDDVKALLKQKSQLCEGCLLQRRTSRRHLQLNPTRTTRNGFRLRPRSIASQQRFPRRVQISGDLPTWLRPYLTQQLSNGYQQVATAANSGWTSPATAYADYGHGTLHLVHPNMRRNRHVVRFQALDDCPVNTPYDIQQYQQDPESYETTRLVRRITNPRSYGLTNLLNGWTKVRHGVCGNSNVPSTLSRTSRGIEVVLNESDLTNAQRSYRPMIRRSASGR